MSNWRVIVRDQFDNLVEKTRWTVLSVAERDYDRLKREYERNKEYRIILDSRD